MKKTLIKLSLLSLLSTITSYSYANAIAKAHEQELDTESSAISFEDDSLLSDDFFLNNLGVLVTQDEIRRLRGQYISDYHYLQDPIALSLGNDNSAGPNGTYHGGIGTSYTITLPTVIGGNTFRATQTGQIWGQTGRLGGFALGGTLIGIANVSQVGQPNTFTPNIILTPSQAYINYLYGNRIDVSLGSILISTPWVNSFASIPGSAIGNSTYQGILINIQTIPNLLFTGFSAYSYSQYPNYNSWLSQRNLYNQNGGPLVNVGNQTTYGPSGLGLNWNPVSAYSGKLWLYNFDSYAQLAYIDNSYHIILSDLFSFDLQAQGFIERSLTPSLVTQTALPGQTTPAGGVSSNGLGTLFAINIGPNTTNIAFNTIFGPNVVHF